MPRQDKVGKVREVRASGRNVAIIGGGVNEAPAPVESQPGIAAGAALVALETAVVAIAAELLERARRLVASTGAASL